MTSRKPRLHLVYSVPNSRLKKLKWKGVPLYRHHWKYFVRWPNPIFAPFSLTYYMLQGLSQQYEVLLYDIPEKGSIELESNDLFLGHLWPDFKTKTPNDNKWEVYDPEQIANRVVLDYPNDKRIFSFSPFNHSFGQMGWAVPLFKQLHCYIGLCGDFWIDTLDQSPFPFLKGMMTHVNMPLDRTKYPHVKRDFNEPGKRKFFYIGRVSKEKNIDMLEQIAANIEGFQGGYIGDGEIKGWKQIAPLAALTPAYMTKLAKEYDFFINTSTYDAQATTVLEAMSWGFPVACTPQTGYVEPSIFRLSKDDVQINKEVIESMQRKSEDELRDIVKQSQALLDKKFTWNLFIEKLKSILANGTVQAN